MKFSDALIAGSFLACSFPGQADNINDSRMTIKMNINERPVEVKLYDGPAAKAFVNTLPLRLTMEELNGNEKFADLADALPADPVRPGTIHAGDLMLYGNKTLVLFYKTFESSYAYTPVGKVVNPESLFLTADNRKIQVGFSR